MADEKKSCEGKFNGEEGTFIGQLKVGIDCSEALTGLTAIQREAKKATAALKEYEEAIAKAYGIPKESLVGVDPKNEQYNSFIKHHLEGDHK